MNRARNCATNCAWLSPFRGRGRPSSVDTVRALFGIGTVGTVLARPDHLAEVDHQGLAVVLILGLGRWLDVSDRLHDRSPVRLASTPADKLVASVPFALAAYVISRVTRPRRRVSSDPLKVPRKDRSAPIRWH
jgi:hypothetical protein